MPDNMEKNGWHEWSRYVLKQLEKNELATKELTDEVSQLKHELTKLRTEFNIKSGMWGILGGALPVAMYLLAEFVKHGQVP